MTTSTYLKSNLLPDSVLLGNRYLLTPNLLGRGSQGQVRTAFDLWKQEYVAVKVVPLFRTTTESINHRHVSGAKNVVKFLDLLHDENYQYQVLSLVDGPSLVEILEERDRLDELTVRRIIQDVVAGLKDIHRLGVAHLDLKLENVMVDLSAGRALLVDFGFSVAFDPNNPFPQVWQRAGSIHYSAPEIVTSVNYGYDPRAADMWSLGVLLYVLVAGYFPFDDESASEGSEDPRVIFTKKATSSYRIPNWVSNELSQLIGGLLIPEPQKRLTIEQVEQNLWFRGLNQQQQNFTNIIYQNLPETSFVTNNAGTCCYYEYCPPSMEEEENFYGLVRGHHSSFSIASAFAG